MNAARFTLLFTLACTGLAPAATVNIQFSQGVNQATNFSSYDGTVSNGLVWGIMVSTSNTTFGAIPYDFQLGTSLAGALIPGTDDYLIISSVLTAQGTTGDAANPGKINTLNSIQMNVPGTNNIVTGNQFALIWFDSVITSPTQNLWTGVQPYGFLAYGIMTDPSWTIPAAGTTRNVSASFSTSPDPVKRANDFVIVPEPGATLLAVLSATLLFRRRRQ
jgi:hypothetical protein